MFKKYLIQRKSRSLQNYISGKRIFFFSFFSLLSLILNLFHLFFFQTFSNKKNFLKSESFVNYRGKFARCTNANGPCFLLTSVSLSLRLAFWWFFKNISFIFFLDDVQRWISNLFVDFLQTSELPAEFICCKSTRHCLTNIRSNLNLQPESICMTRIVIDGHVFLLLPTDSETGLNSHFHERTAKPNDGVIGTTRNPQTGF